jgi:hypothetical protein
MVPDSFQASFSYSFGLSHHVKERGQSRFLLFFSLPLFAIGIAKVEKDFVHPRVSQKKSLNL